MQYYVACPRCNRSIPIVPINISTPVYCDFCGKKWVHNALRPTDIPKQNIQFPMDWDELNKIIEEEDKKYRRRK